MFGKKEFISYDQLQAGYLKPDGSMDIGVYLKINSFKRSSDVE